MDKAKRYCLGVGVLLAGCLTVLGCYHLQSPERPVPATRLPGVSLKVRPRTSSPLFDPALAPAMLDEPARDRWQQPAKIVKALNLRSGEVVADVGSGSGYLLPYLSRAVGSSGKVYAEEIQAAFLPALRARANSLGNIHVVLGTADDPGLPAHGIDCFMLLTVYHEVEHPVSFLQTLRRFARPGAQLAIIDFDSSRNGDPPAPPGHEVWERDVLAEAHQAGWTLLRRYDFLSSQFFLIFGMNATATR